MKFYLYKDFLESEEKKIDNPELLDYNGDSYLYANGDHSEVTAIRTETTWRQNEELDVETFYGDDAKTLIWYLTKRDEVQECMLESYDDEDIEILKNGDGPNGWDLEDATDEYIEDGVNEILGRF